MGQAGSGDDTRPGNPAKLSPAPCLLLLRVLIINPPGRAHESEKELAIFRF